MTDKTALRHLIEAVEAGEPDAWHGCGDVLGIENGMNLHRAYDGSLDAAKALHEALLPGWHPVIGRNVHHHYWHANVQRVGGDGLIICEGTTDQTDPARAWLIAILKACEAQTA